LTLCIVSPILGFKMFLYVLCIAMQKLLPQVLPQDWEGRIDEIY